MGPFVAGVMACEAASTVLALPEKAAIIQNRNGLACMPENANYK